MNRATLLGLLVPLVMGAQSRPWIDVYGEESAAATNSCAIRQWEVCRTHLLRLKDILDGRGDVIYRLGNVEEELGNRDAAAAYFALYSKMGLQLGAPEHNPPATAVSISKPFATLPQNDLIAEDIAYDPATSRFFVSSVRHRKILAMSKDGKFTDFLADSEWPILALAVDAKRRLLWATTAAMPEGLDYKAGDDGKSPLLQFHLDSGKLLRRYDIPTTGKHALGDMTLAASGDAYISDGYGVVYRLRSGGEQLEVLIGPGTFRSPQTPALSDDGRKLLVPDYSRGISIVDLATKESKLLSHPPELSLGGIDGMYLSGRTLIAIQNGTAPPRIIRMQLDGLLSRIEKWETVEANWKGLGDPTHGVLVDGRFYFIANSGWDVKAGGTYEAPSIRVF